VAKKKHRRDKKKKKPAPSLPSGVAAALREAGSLMRQGRPAKAAELLSQADRRHPNNPTLLAALLDAYHRLRDFAEYLRVIIQLQALTPDNPNQLLMLAAAHALNGFPALALRAYEQFLERWPSRPESETARPEAATFRAMLEENLFPRLGAGGEVALELAVLHDEVQVFLSQGKFARARETAARLLERRPDFGPAWNNTSEAFIREGRFPEAAEACGRVLALEPDNFFALSNLTRCQYLSGRLDEAWATAGRLKAVTSAAPDVWAKKVEALSYLGDDQGVLEVWQAAGASETAGEALQDELFLHLVAVAHWRLGQEDEARRLWQEALRCSPGLEVAAENLDDLRKPAGKRHAPWPFAFNNWMAKEALCGAVFGRRPPVGGHAGQVPAGRSERAGHADAAARAVGLEARAGVVRPASFRRTSAVPRRLRGDPRTRGRPRLHWPAGCCGRTPPGRTA
jgi:tetratricopeptide (TPR) repeat protein